MNANWRWKVWLTALAAVLSLYSLLPTLLGFKTIREEAVKNNRPVPDYVSFFPEKTLNLGLDLQGGMYLELEVLLQEHIDAHLDFLTGEISNVFKNKKLSSSNATRAEGSRLIRLLLDRPATSDEVRQVLKDQGLDGSLQSVNPQEFEWVYASDEKEVSKRDELSAQLKKAFAGKGVVVAEESESGNFRITLKKRGQTVGVPGLIKSQFASLKEVAEPNKILFEIKSLSVEEFSSKTVGQVLEIVRKRIDRYGVAEPSIRQLGENRIIVELPGITDPDRAVSLVKQSGRLEFKLVDYSKTPEELKILVAEAEILPNPIETETSDAAESAPESAPALGTDQKTPARYTNEWVALLNKKLKNKLPPNTEIRFQMPGEVPYLLPRKAEITGQMIENVDKTQDEMGMPAVSLSFDLTGAKLFGELTRANVGKQFAILLDGTITSAPTINAAIPGGKALITQGAGSYDEKLKSANDLILVLKEGSLPATLKEVNKTVIGPSLGQSAIHEGMLAALLAGLTVVVFMLIYYKGSGLIANLALVLNVLLILGILATFQATLTLPGIAGIVLTMAMALDASIIIFERIREELKSGKIVKAAVNAGFSNALNAVIDTHITTFLSGAVLYYFGTGPIRGFAVTLMVGVVTTLFTAYWVTRWVYEYLTVKVQIKKVSI